MPSLILFFAAGVAWLQWQATLPSMSALAIAAGAGTGLFLLRCRMPWPGWGRLSGFLGMALLGVAWAGFMAQHRLADALPEASEGVDLQVVGTVASMPQRFEHGWRFDFDVAQSSKAVPSTLSLAWYQAVRGGDSEEIAPIPALHAGDRWAFTLRLKRPHGNRNPHGFDYEGWLFERGIRATGYVRPAPDNRLLGASPFRPMLLIEQIREDIRARLDAVLDGRPYSGILVALAVGDQQAIDGSLWQVFSRTGLTHLMSISGLHITLVAGLVAAAIGALWRRFPALLLRWPAQRVSSIAAVVAALGYCLLAGFAVPAQRTFYMIAAVALGQMSGRAYGPWRLLSWALLAVLLVDPWAVLSAGFWLSFGAVVLLLHVGTGYRETPSPWRRWGMAQWAMSVGMVPLLLALFQQFSWVSPLANAVAIPVVSFLVTPLALAAAIPGLEFLALPAQGILALLMAGVEALARWPGAVWQQAAPPVWATLLGGLGALWLLLPKGVPARWLGGIMLLPLFLLPPWRPADDGARIVVLDVGQGLAVHVQTARHDLLFDTGPAFSTEANSGNRIILPYLRAMGVDRLDGLVVTHADRDHSGGAASVVEGIPVGWTLDSLPLDHPLGSVFPQRRFCQAGQGWTWEGVRFDLIHPAPERAIDPAAKTNNMSCVLRIEAAGHAVLLTSDIEAISERELLAHHRDALRAEVLLVPHHGSRTSSTLEFIEAVAPRQVIVPAGYRNRFGHPKPEVMARYQATGAAIFRTDADGALTLDVTSRGVEIRRERQQDVRYWQGR